MGKTSVIFQIISLFLSFSIIGCGGTSSVPVSQPVGTDIIQKYNLHVQGKPSTTGISLPQQFNDANWGLKEQLCEQAGYSLTPYAGESISLISYNLSDTITLPTQTGSINVPLNLIVLAKDQISVCGFLSVKDAVPGLFAVNNPNVTRSSN